MTKTGIYNDTVFLYTDGGCEPNPGLGTWACLLRCGRITKELSGYETDSTNNRMELTAVIEGLKSLDGSFSVRIVTDSKYVINCINGARKWLENGRNAPNKDLLHALVLQLSRHSVSVEKVTGHSGHEDNDYCDGLCTELRERIQKS